MGIYNGKRRGRRLAFAISWDDSFYRRAFRSRSDEISWEAKEILLICNFLLKGR